MYCNPIDIECSGRRLGRWRKFHSRLASTNLRRRVWKSPMPAPGTPRDEQRSEENMSHQKRAVEGTAKCSAAEAPQWLPAQQVFYHCTRPTPGTAPLFQIPKTNTKHEHGSSALSTTGPPLKLPLLLLRRRRHELGCHEAAHGPRVR